MEERAVQRSGEISPLLPAAADCLQGHHFVLQARLSHFQTINIPFLIVVE